MASVLPFPTTIIAEPRTIRLVASARLRDPVLLKLAGNETQLSDLAEIEGATSGRLHAQKRGTDHINPQEMVAAVPHAHFINAAFSYWLPKDLNRFNGPGRGAWYAALQLETCLREVIYHMNRELTNIRSFNTSVEYTEMFASFAGEFVDLRASNPAPPCLHPMPEHGYREGNMLAENVRTYGHNGIIYPSVRHEGGTCLVALHPKAVQSVAQGQIYKIVWTGTPEPQVVRR